MGISINYFLKYYDNLTLFIDNNAQERLLRNLVIGRKNWFGPQSSPKRGQTASVLFTLVESNKVNPRECLKNLVFDINSGKEITTPSKHSARLET
jgi:hypothetical protein